MRINIVTIFPDFFEVPLRTSIPGRAREKGLVEFRVVDLRDFTHDRHRTVDDAPYGGGAGMVMKPEPFFEAVEWLAGDGSASDEGLPSKDVSAETSRPGEIDAGPARASTPAAADVSAETSATPETSEPQEAPGARGEPSAPMHVRRPPGPVILLSPRGRLFRHEDAVRLSLEQEVTLLAGHYKDVDQRVAEHLATEELSLGDFVLSGGEIAALAVTDAVVRLLPGAMGDHDSAATDSFYEHRGLSAPSYTRPAEFRGLRVPEVLLSGDHARVRAWREETSERLTRERRPELAAAGEEEAAQDAPEEEPGGAAGSSPPGGEA